MNKERPDEREAKKTIEKVLGIKLQHADINAGDVDYRSTDGRHAVEVTRVTDGRRRAGRDALDASRATGTPPGVLQTCWLVMFPDTQYGLKTFLQRVHSALVRLELTGELSFKRQHAAAHVRREGPGDPLSVIYQQLLEAGVEHASRLPDHAESHTHRVRPSPGSGGASSSSDQALDLLTDELSKKTDNPKKLKASGAEHRHLFVWLDDDTRFAIARPLSHAAPWNEGFGLPSTPPVLDPAITHLWVVHQASGLGWLWDGQAWQEL